MRGPVADMAANLLARPTHYERLGVPDTASAAQIDAAWQQHQRRLATLPPPLTPSLALPGTPPSAQLDAAALRLAYEVLHDEARRAVYDAWLRREAAGAAALHPPWWRRARFRWAAALVLLAAAVAGGTWWWLGTSAPAF